MSGFQVKGLIKYNCQSYVWQNDGTTCLSSICYSWKVPYWLKNLLQINVVKLSKIRQNSDFSSYTYWEPDKILPSHICIGGQNLTHNSYKVDKTTKVNKNFKIKALMILMRGEIWSHSPPLPSQYHLHYKSSSDYNPIWKLCNSQQLCWLTC